MTPTKDQQAREYAEKVNYPCPDYDWYESDDEHMKECLAKVWLDGYTAAEQSMTDSEATVIQGWVARNHEPCHGYDLHLFTSKPIRRQIMGDWYGHGETKLDTKLFPSLSWESEPVECEIIIKPKKR